jgi:hypothetical protein
VTNFHLTWPFARAAALVRAWQGWAPLAPDELAASLKVTAAGEIDRPASVDVYGALLGTGSDATELLDELIARAGADPVQAWIRQLSFAETRRFWANLPVGEPGTGDRPHPPTAQHPHMGGCRVNLRREAGGVCAVGGATGSPRPACQAGRACRSFSMLCDAQIRRHSLFTAGSPRRANLR